MYMHSRGFTIVELLIVIVVIAILAAITIVAYTGIQDRAKSSSETAALSQWKKESELYKVENNIECPANYAFIYGNSTLGTSDFCVMKYEAKNVGGVATSEAAGTPWANITQPAAITAAAAACAGCHLITETEWMTIAADVLGVQYNWSGGEVGSGIVYQGHVNNNPASALAASTDDSDDLIGITGGIGTGSGSNSSRVLWLSSGDAIWDLSGNLWEWTSGSSTGAQPGTSGYSWVQYPSVSSLGNVPATSFPSALMSTPSLASIASWNSNQGIGQLYSNSTETGTRVYFRGGTWDNTTLAGVLSFNLSRPGSTTGANTGFRVAK